MSKPKFQIGDEVWRAGTKTRPVHYKCLECMGKGFLTVILGQDSQVTIPCECCKRGYLGSNGYHDKYEHYEAAEVGVVGGVELTAEGFEYRVPCGPNSMWCVKETDLFADEDSAKARADELSTERTAREAELNCTKHNADRSWAWNVKYHRQAIRDAQKSLEYHASQLDYAKSKVAQ